MKFLPLSFAFLFLAVSSALAQRTDLSGLKICLDPGHGGHNSNDRHMVPDPGVDFYESESNFQKALLLKPMLEALGATVILTRTSNDTTGYNNPDDPDEPSLTARVALANANNVDWFHSIHSNAIGNGFQTGAPVNYTLMLVREKRSLTDPGASSGNGLGVPERPESWTMASIMAPAVQGALRGSMNQTFLDWTFYGGTNGGFSLGVLRGLLMPGELSEGSMHDYAPETRRLMNNSYRKMEAYALRNSFMQFFGLPADCRSIVAGIQTDIASGLPLNGTAVRLLPENRLFTGDAFNNGFYMFDSLSPGAHTVRFETAGFDVDSMQINPASGSRIFIDRMLTKEGAPQLVTWTPVDGDTAANPTYPIKLVFSKPMNTASVQSAFTITPTAAGTFSWTSNNSAMQYTPSAILPFQTDFIVRLDTGAHAVSGQALGSPFVVHFRTRSIDAFPPKIVSIFPDSGSASASASNVICITFSEPLNPVSVNTTNFAIKKSGGALLPKTVQYWEAGGKGGVNMYVTAGLEAGQSYMVRVSNVADTAGNVIPPTAPFVWTFATSPSILQVTAIDSLDSPASSWLQPAGSGSTTGIDSASFSFAPSPVVSLITPDAGSARLNFAWNPVAADWLLREYLSGGPARNFHWRKEGIILQVYLLGDGSGTQFRFAVDDSVDVFPAGNAPNHEVSRWFTVDWVGWRLVEWDLEHDSVGAWIGNQKLEGEMRFDSFQLRFLPGVSAYRGQISLDQLQVARVSGSTGVEAMTRDIPLRYELHQNYPNPFNPTTVVSYQLPVFSEVRLVVYDILGREVNTLVNARQSPGRYTVRFDASSLASGLYFYRLEAGSYTQVMKMVVLK